MDVFQAAELFGVKPGTIRQWTSLGLISPLIRGELGKNKRSLYWRPDLVAYKQSRDGALEAAA
jgi:DNA-binding transcriptional MerR regulator